MDGIETATDSLERHQHLKEHPEAHHARRMALLIGVLAAALAICEMGEKSAQNDYISRQIAVSDTWAFYQAKSIKGDIAASQAATLQALAASERDAAALHGSDAASLHGRDAASLHGRDAALLHGRDAASLHGTDSVVQAMAKASAARAAKELSDPAGREGKAQLKQQALRQTAARDHQLERYHLLEVVVGALQISIVLASVSVVTEMVWFGLVALGLGGLAFVGGLGVMALL